MRASRTINGKKYYLLGYATARPLNKSKAIKEAKDYINRGYRVRRIKVKKGFRLYGR